MPDDKPFQALWYENDGEICVVTGSIKQPRQEDDERTFHVANNLVIFAKGCPLICHGLVSASHLNGELYEVRALNNNITGFRLEATLWKDEPEVPIGKAGEFENLLWIAKQRVTLFWNSSRTCNCPIIVLIRIKSFLRNVTASHPRYLQRSFT